jgi:hypothetical protein
MQKYHAFRTALCTPRLWLDPTNVLVLVCCVYVCLV